MRHFASQNFWSDREKLSPDIRALADKNFALLKENPRHPSLHFKKVGKYWSARVGNRYRALAVEIPEGFLWFTIVPHTTYDKMI